MILAQNHLQLSSGNKIFIFFLFTLFLQGCFLFRDRPSDPRPAPEPVDTTGVSIGIDTIEADIDTLEGPPKGQLKDIYNVVVLLPFKVDKNFIENFEHNQRSPNAYRPLYALEFYEGVRMALQELDAKGVGMKVDVFDTQNNTDVVEMLLHKSAMREADLIVGPFFQQNIDIVAEFAAEKKKYMVSPVLSRVDIDLPNPFFLQATPTISSHGRKIGEYVKSHYPESKVILVRKEGNEDMTVLTRIIKDTYNATPPHYGEITFWNEEIVAEEKLPAYSKGDFSLLDTTVIIVASSDRTFIDRVTRQLDPIADERPIVVIGMPNWVDLIKELEEDDIFIRLNHLNFHYTASFWDPRSEMKQEQFKAVVHDTMQVITTSMTKKGYFLTLHHAFMLENYGIDFPHYFHRAPQAEWASPFNFQPVFIEPTSIFRPSNVLYYENVDIPVIRYQNFYFIRAD